MFLSALELMFRRSLSHWKLLSAVIIGVMLAVSIMSLETRFSFLVAGISGPISSISSERDFCGRQKPEI